jgi:rhodanese-related sulfurtransferase
MKFDELLFTTVFLFLITLSGFAQSGILPEELDSLIQNKSNILIIDVRPDYEFQESNQIPEAVHIPYEMLAIELKKRGLEFSKPLVVYDRSGNIGKLAANFLRKMGYIHVRYIYGGLYAWEDYQTKKESGVSMTPELPFGASNDVIKDSSQKEISVDSLLLKKEIPDTSRESSSNP